MREPRSEMHGGRSGFVVASNLIVKEGRPVRYLYREEPSGHDTGWRLFSGEEDPEYRENASNFGVYSVITIAEIDPSVGDLLDSPSGSAFRRPAAGKPFRSVRRAD